MPEEVPPPKPPEKPVYIEKPQRVKDEERRREDDLDKQRRGVPDKDDHMEPEEYDS